MTSLRVAHTADLSDADRSAVRHLLEDAFADEPVTEADLEHALGGVHALVEEAGDQAAVNRALAAREKERLGPDGLASLTAVGLPESCFLRTASR